jgi:hypothetical protein
VPRDFSPASLTVGRRGGRGRGFGGWQTYTGRHDIDDDELRAPLSAGGSVPPELKRMKRKRAANDEVIIPMVSEASNNGGIGST